MNNKEQSEQFLKLCELRELKILNYHLETNLNNWNINITDYRIKSGQWHVTIVMPYKEMNVTLNEIINDKQLFSCHLARLSLNTEDTNTDTDSYWTFNKSIVLKFSTDVKYLLFDTPYIYPHNMYLFNNHKYLYNKILYSVTMFKNFFEMYNNLFSSGIPIIFVKSTLETKSHYIINLVLTSCITITYIKSDIENNTIYCNMFVDNNMKNNKTNMYHNSILEIPRAIKNNNIKFIFVTSQKD